jgi:hypothetical protein
MFGFLFLLKGGLIITVIRNVFLWYWKGEMKKILNEEATVRGYLIISIRKPGREALKISPFAHDPEQVNTAGNWLYYRIVEVVNLQTTMATKFWIRISLDKEGKYTTDWQPIFK